MRPYLYTLTCALIMLVALSCHKSDPATDTEDTSPNIDGDADSTFVDSSTVRFPTIENYSCTNSPDYGTSVIYSKWKGPHKDAVITPSNNKNVAGTYYAWPAGLAINPSTGEINITHSETGIRYAVAFVKAGTTDTCMTKIILGGATFVDSIYVLSNNDTLAIPFFNASPAPIAVCDDSGDDDYPGNSGNGHGHGNNKCEWDDDDDADGNGPGDEPPPGQQANLKKIRVRTISGGINLKKTLADGAFGSNPQNGDKISATIYYRLNDVSKKVLQKIKVELIYYNKRTDIPAAVVNEIAAKRNDFNQSRIISPNGKPRPPQIVITRFAN